MSPHAPRTISVVIPHFFAARLPNLTSMLEALAQSTVRPVEVILWNNDAPWGERGVIPAQDPPAFQTWVYQSAHNLGPHARFLAALAATGDDICFLDNDTIPDRGMLANLLRWRAEYPDTILTLEGREWLTTVPYAHWPKWYGHGLVAAGHTTPVPISHSLGRGELVPRTLLPKILSRFPFDPDTVMDDLWFSACAHMARVGILIVPTEKGESHLGNLPRGGVGLSTQGPVYYAARDAAVQRIQERFRLRVER